MGRISMPQGKGSQLHNRRDYEKIGREIPDNINSLMTHENVTIVDKDIRSAYREIFGEVLQEYNSRQKRSDRKIDDYYEHILKSKNGEKPFYEDVLQWGRMEDFRAEPQLREKAKECLVEYARTFEARNPNLKLIGAYVHMDEASPHLHLDYIPVAKGYKIGLQARNSLDKAMKQMGYTPVKESRKNNATKLWKENEREYFGELCRSKGLKVEAERSLGRKQFTVSEFKEAQNEMLEEIKADMLPVIENYNTRKDEALNAAIQAKGKAQAEKARYESFKVLADEQAKLIDETSNRIQEKSAELDEKLEKLSAMNELSEKVDKAHTLREQKYSIENHTIEAKKSLFGKIEAPERTGVFVEGLKKEQVQNIFSRYIFNKSIEETYNSMKSWVQEQKDKIDKYYKDLNARIKVLTRQKDTLTAEIENIKQIRHSLEPLRKEVASLQKSKDILTRNIRTAYQERFHIREKRKDEELWLLSYHDMLAVIYNDGRLKRISDVSSTNNLPADIQKDLKAGLCKICVYEPEKSVQIPQRVLDELIDKIDKTKPVSQDVANLINQTNEVEEVIQEHHLRLPQYSQQYVQKPL